MVPAFFIAGGIDSVIPRNSIVKYLGAGTKKWVSYSIASVSGMALAVCSCTILPMFASIYKKGAGIGPASAFLFSGPAINLLAIVFTARVLGLDLGAARAFFAVFAAIVIGIIMAFFFQKNDSESSFENQGFSTGVEKEGKSKWVLVAFFGLQVAILLVAASPILGELIRYFGSLILILVLAIVLKKYFTSKEVKKWFEKTWWFVKLIFPVLIAGTFVIGVIGGSAAIFQGMDPFEPVNIGEKTFMAYKVSIGQYTQQLFGQNTLLSNLVASVIGAVLYMPTLLEVPIVGDFFGYLHGMMDAGPALAILLAGPSMSLPNMIVIWRVMKTKRTLLYISLVAIVSTLIGLLWGFLV
ncbi:MAG: putative permease [Candidatus Methanohalarchaeum thermophilum]|uniref:Permease n=1 Tax=Methanohalarchaeum thermophilum TaxID=1903181 RepID=A0A1Q6DWT6_METT1|nr:MAG: putative permease [Candidatus Methanohalarchaeum thermophilum]